MIAALFCRYPTGVFPLGVEVTVSGHGAAVESERIERFKMSTAGYLVEGMTCGYCMGKVHEKVRSLSGVTKVAMDLGTAGQSPLLVMSGTKLGAEAVRDAVESAGFGLLPPRGQELRPHGDDASPQRSETRPDRQ